MAMPVGETVEPEFLPTLDIQAPERQRRWTVLLRAILLIPHFIWLGLLAIAVAVVAVISWFGALFLGRLPDWSADFLGGYLGYYTRVYAYWYLLVDSYPPFAWNGPEHPVQITLQRGKLNRLAVLFRIILVIPASIVAELTAAGWAALSFFIWLIVLILGRTPKPVFGATAAVLRYGFRLQAYFLLLTPAYPKRLFGDAEQAAEPAQEAAPTSDTRPLLVTQGARVLLIVFIVLGLFSAIGEGVSGSISGDNQQATTSYDGIGVR
ncbi:MAG TPA: DUF4389 domain-containing protein [Pseudonocardiaceae bacterium]|nr:DUF4389 domain-containing protein [Pseudonocardiaceae bacterium]